MAVTMETGGNETGKNEGSRFQAQKIPVSISFPSQLKESGSFPFPFPARCR
jgi:hypothetical protein